MSSGEWVDRHVKIYALGRGLFGLGCLVAPDAMSRISTGEEARPDGKPFIRGFGIRDIVMAVELLFAQRRGRNRRRLLFLFGLCGVIDTVSSAAVGSELPLAARRGVAAAGLDAVTGLTLSALVRE